MARIIVSYVLRRFQMLPLLIRTQDILYYRHVRSYAFVCILHYNYLDYGLIGFFQSDGNLYHLANFFGTLQIQALMITMAQDVRGVLEIKIMYFVLKRCIGGYKKAIC